MHSSILVELKKIVLLAFMLVLFSTVMSLYVVAFLGLRITYALPYTGIDVETAYNMITNGSYPDLVILDVRRQDEYDTGHIYGAVWIPHTELETRISELAGHENHEIIVYCRTGVRSVNASETLDSYNFTKVYNMLGGITAWQSTGYPVWIATVHNVNTTFNYDTIQAAIDDPQTLDGHTILVDAGTYYENVVVNKTVSLIGENKYNTIIDGNGTGTVMDVTANNVNITGFTIQNSGDAGGLCLWNTTNSKIENVAVSNNYAGIFLSLSSNNTVSGNIASNNNLGICLDRSNNNTVSGNNASNNGCGFFTYTCTGNTFLGNNASNNGCGIRLYGLSNNNTVSGNNASSNSDVGIHLDGGSKNNVVSGNIASNNNLGIYIYEYSQGNTISDNTAANNTYGIYFADHSDDNMVFHNNFVDNTQQTYSLTSTNFWDNGFEGNYWRNYPGVDSNHDGIGDSYHVLDANNTDHCPLMGMFSDFNATSEYHVQTICNSSISDFQFNGTAICFNVTGEDVTTGFCRLCIPRALMNETYKVFVNGIEVPCNLLPFSNSTHSYLYFTYNHSTQEVIVIPEFPTWISMLLLLVVLTVAIAIYKRRLLKTPIH